MEYIGTSKRGITTEFRMSVPWGCVAGKVYGDKKNFPVICTHGLLDNCNTFDGLIPYLPKDKFYVMVDFPGHGLSSPLPPGMNYSFYVYTDTIHRICNYFGWTIFSCIGHSMGGCASTMFAASYPEKVDKLILLDLAGILAKPPELLPQRLRYSLEKCAEFEKDSNYREIPRKYNETKRRLLAGNTMLTEMAADILMERGCDDRGDGMTTFRRDPRVKHRVAVSFALDAALGFVKCVEAETLHIMAKDGGFADINGVPFSANASKLILQGFENAESHKIVNVEGKHHVHLCHPERVGKHVAEFLNKPVRLKLQNNSSTNPRL